MYICYLDESGTTQKGDQSVNFVYAGLAIPANTWKEKDVAISALKAKHGLDGAEIHTAWLLRKYVEQAIITDFDKLSRNERVKTVEDLRIGELNKLDLKGDLKKKRERMKLYRETSPYIHLTLEERRVFIKEVCECISSWDDARIFFHAIKKEKYDPTLNNVGGIYEDAFCQVITRFQNFLENISKKGPTVCGLLVSDNNESIQGKLTKLTRSFHKMGAFWRDIPNIVETPLFVDSKQTSMIQLADVVAYSMRRYFDVGESDSFHILKPRFGRHRGKMESGRHFTPQETCQCQICSLVALQHSRKKTRKSRG